MNLEQICSVIQTTIAILIPIVAGIAYFCEFRGWMKSVKESLSSGAKRFGVHARRIKHVQRRVKKVEGEVVQIDGRVTTIERVVG